MISKNTAAQSFWVGIGASAGGLEALRVLVKNLSDNTGAIYVVVQHMSPQHKSLLTELIGRETSLPVTEITDGLIPEPNGIYVGPPNHDVIVSGAALQLRAPSHEPAVPKPSVDRFFRSLAETVGNRAIGVVLSGTGSDGAYGIQAIRAAGGITIAQDEKTAKYNGMPLSAMDTGCIDLVLSPQQIGAQFERITQLPRDLDGIGEDEVPRDALSDLFQILLARTRVDFREYKSSTVRRRIERRMNALSLSEIDDYLTQLRSSPGEVDALFRDLLISVTSFFRDKEEFLALSELVGPMVEQRRSKGIRVWVPGCATGEEAYTVALLLIEALGGIEELDKTTVQIFATDIDVNALTIARRGQYPEAALDDVPVELRRRYFERSPGSYTINKVIRDRVVFTPHNLCQDPPFSNVDLISCRNLLIYFGATLQKRVLARLHYSLNSTGLLFLGKSETITGSEDLFQTASDRHRVFRRKVAIDRIKRDVSASAGRITRYDLPGIRGEDTQSLEMAGALFDSLSRAIGPNSILVSEDLHIRRIFGNIDKFVSLSEGFVRGATISMLRADVRHEVRTLVTLAFRNNTMRSGATRRRDNDDPVRMQIRVYPLKASHGAESLALVVFAEWEEEESETFDLTATDEESRDQIVLLQRELDSTRESLQQTVEELETTNEELQALNEEMQSANEELQSTNEELETANEELQSTNEELITVNEELQINSHELTMLNQELDSILANIAAPVLVVDDGLHIVRCSQTARALFNIEPGVGKPHVSQCSLPEGFPPLSKFMSEVIRTGTKHELEVETDDFKGSIAAAPYFNPKGELIGATAIVADTSALLVRAELEMLLNSVPVMIWHVGENGEVINLNKAAADRVPILPVEAIGKDFYELASGLTQGSRESDKELIDAGDKQLGKIERVGGDDRPMKWFQTDRVPYESSERGRGLYIVSQDITSEYEARIQLNERQALVDSIIETIPVGLEFIDNNEVLRLQNKMARALKGRQVTGKRWKRISPEASAYDVETGEEMLPEDHPILRALRGQRQVGSLIRYKAKDGRQSFIQRNASPVIDENGDVLGAVNAVADVTEDHLVRADLRWRSDLMGMAEEATGIGFWRHDLADNALYWSPQVYRLHGLESAEFEPSIDDMIDRLHADDREMVRRALTATIEEAVPFSIRARIAQASGDQLPVLLSGRVERDSAGAAVAVIGICRPISADDAVVTTYVAKEKA